MRMFDGEEDSDDGMMGIKKKKRYRRNTST